MVKPVSEARRKQARIELDKNQYMYLARTARRLQHLSKHMMRLMNVPEDELIMPRRKRKKTRTVNRSAKRTPASAPQQQPVSA